MNITTEFWDFIEKYLPDYHTRNDVLRHSQLQLFIDGHESTITEEKISIEQARHELDSLTLRFTYEAINGYTQTHTKQNPMRCRECGSIDVQYAAWLDTNTGEYRGIISGETADLWCESCQSHTHQVTESEFLEDVNEWWEYEDALSKQEISGIELQGFCTEANPEEAFEQALKEYWDNLSTDQKIKIWCSQIYPKADDK